MTLSVDSVISLLSDLVHCSIDVCSLVVGVATFNATCLQLVTSMNTFNEHFLSFWEKPENQNTLSAILFKTFSRQSIRTIFIIIFSSIISLTLGSEACAHWRLQMEQIYEHENRFIQYIKHLTRVYLEHNSVGT
jgi:flagellar biosynthesis protein FlhB